jgi:hypothetical protein
MRTPGGIEPIEEDRKKARKDLLTLVSREFLDGPFRPLKLGFLL